MRLITEKIEDKGEKNKVLLISTLSYPSVICLCPVLSADSCSVSSSSSSGSVGASSPPSSSSFTLRSTSSSMCPPPSLPLKKGFGFRCFRLDMSGWAARGGAAPWWLLLLEALLLLLLLLAGGAGASAAAVEAVVVEEGGGGGGSFTACSVESMDKTGKKGGNKSRMSDRNVRTAVTFLRPRVRRHWNRELKFLPAVPQNVTLASNEWKWGQE